MSINWITDTSSGSSYDVKISTFLDYYLLIFNAIDVPSRQAITNYEFILYIINIPLIFGVLGFWGFGVALVPEAELLARFQK